MLSSLDIAIVILVVVILLYVFPATRSCITKTAPWLALVTGGLAVGVLLMTSPGEGGVFGGGSKKRRGRKRGGSEGHESLDDEETTVAEIEAFLNEDGDAGDESGDVVEDHLPLVPPQDDRRQCCDPRRHRRAPPPRGRAPGAQGPGGPAHLRLPLQ